ncbi:recQ-mediated genome instability protein 1 [Carya illinoinensis]|uniref:RecQ-mediated genome instability protein 1 n=1 Tax=Carya illinoinensis TaxID=32201 RepID=A0A8T1NGD3_CARIL|nr:recQ-mediated genome instability protein 1 [Carya illinoinensis]KAG6630886.1 hypothetical protein CIPAW_13G052100 [Carya illinoinensis]
MPRRRLRLGCSSDEEDDNLQQQLQEEPENENPDPNPNIYLSEPIEISDDDLINVHEDFSRYSHHPAVTASEHSAQPPPVTPASSSSGEGEGEGCSIGDFLGRLGLRLKTEWLGACLNSLQTSVPGFSSLDVAAKSKLCFERFLVSDMNYCGDGVLPQNVDSMHLVDLPGPYVLQVDEIVNISCPLRGRYQETPSGIKRCLKLSMTDGVQRVFAMEYRPIQALEVFSPAGQKVIVCNLHVRHGLLMLVPEAFEVLGGLVEELEAARKRLVDEVNKPPRGKRMRTGSVPTLVTRATLAAWPPNGVNAAGQNNSSMLQDRTPFPANYQGVTAIPSCTNTSQRTTGESAASTIENAAPSTSPSVIMGFEEMHIDAAPVSRANTVPNPSPHIVSEVEDIHMVDEVDHPLILSGDQEIPFTYLSSLSAKLSAMKEKSHSVQGKIKCFLTGVKGFQYKQRTKYELRAYVDDGSLIAEILIDHDVVHKGIGHSPEEVTAALSSSDKKIVSDMKETLRQFQIFLANFEGTMLIEMNKTSLLPISLEMNQGCPESDAWLLLRRLKSLSAQTPQLFPLHPIDVSP